MEPRLKAKMEVLKPAILVGFIYN